jgi:signal transduction histidine kinase
LATMRDKGSKPMSATKAIAIAQWDAPPPRWADREHGGHVAQFYATDAFLLKSVSRFIGTALGAGDAAIAIATPEHLNGLWRALKRRGLEIAGIAKQGRYVALDAEEILSSFMVNGLPDESRFQKVMGSLISRSRAKGEGKEKRLAIFGEMVALLWARQQAPAALHLEKLWNALGGTQEFTLHCGYPIQEFNREEHGDFFLQVCREHSNVIPEESYSALTTEGERLRNIALLQQRAQALENEIAERRRAEQELREARDQLEKRVAERTVELEAKNWQISQQTEALEATNRDLRQLSARLLRVQDEERRRIARDLHDSTGQIVALLCMNLSALQTEAEKSNPELAKSIAENAGLLDRVSEELRTISYLLHPPLLDEMGLSSALRWYVDGFAQRSGIRVSLALHFDRGRLSRDLETAIFRVVQECLTNIHRHSESPTAEIQLRQISGNLVLQISDEGKGIPAGKMSQIASSGVSGVGVRGMRERIKDFGGEFDLASDETGTRVTVAIPLAASVNA